jgi:hypothetical protein
MKHGNKEMKKMKRKPMMYGGNGGMKRKKAMGGGEIMKDSQPMYSEAMPKAQPN